MLENDIHFRDWLTFSTIKERRSILSVKDASFAADGGIDKNER